MSEITKERIEKLRAQRQALLAEYRKRGYEDGVAFVNEWGEYEDIYDFVTRPDWRECLDGSSDWYLRVEEQLEPAVDSDAYYAGFHEGSVDAWKRVERKLVHGPVQVDGHEFLPA